MSMRFDWTEFKGVDLIRDTFIETGTTNCGSLDQAVKRMFKVIHSCDCIAKYVDNARAKYFNDSRVHLHLGHSPSVLRRIIDPISSTTFWLDAHWRGGDSSDRLPEIECPLSEELSVIFSFTWKILPIVIIDDEYMFTEDRFLPGFNRAQWPLLSEIKAQFPVDKYQFDIFDGAIFALPNECF